MLGFFLQLLSCLSSVPSSALRCYGKDIMDLSSTSEELLGNGAADFEELER